MNEIMEAGSEEEKGFIIDKNDKNQINDYRCSFSFEDTNNYNLSSVES